MEYYRICDLLLESDTQDDTPSNMGVTLAGLKDIKSTILNLCQPFLTRDGGVLVRGSNTMDHTKPGIRKVRKDRKTLDTDPIIQLILDRILTELGGARRGQSMFAVDLEHSDDANGVDQYGDLFLVFPCGEYKLSYVNGVNDIYNSKSIGLSDLPHLPDVMYEGLYELIRSTNSYSDMMSKLNDKLGEINSGDIDGKFHTLLTNAVDTIEKQFNFHSNNVVSNGRSGDANGAEITVECDSYIYVPLHNRPDIVRVRAELVEVGLANKLT